MSEDRAKKVLIIEDKPDHMRSHRFLLGDVVIEDLSLDFRNILIESIRHLKINGATTKCHNESDLITHICDYAKGFLPDLIILDQIMPVEGIRIYPRLRDGYRGHILFVTVESGRREVREIVKGDDKASILLKPFSDNILEKRVRNILESR